MGNILMCLIYFFVRSTEKNEHIIRPDQSLSFTIPNEVIQDGPRFGPATYPPLLVFNGKGICANIMLNYYFLVKIYGNYFNTNILHS